MLPESNSAGRSNGGAVERRLLVGSVCENFRQQPAIESEQVTPPGDARRAAHGSDFALRRLSRKLNSNDLLLDAKKRLNGERVSPSTSHDWRWARPLG